MSSNLGTLILGARSERRERRESNGIASSGISYIPKSRRKLMIIIDIKQAPNGK
jgi:hypothetical protein